MKIRIPKTIQLVAPLWTKKMRTRKSFVELGSRCMIDDKMLDIQTYSCCIVGETLNLFDISLTQFQNKMLLEGYRADEIITKYHKNCSECTAFSEAFNTIIITQYWRDEDTRQKTLSVKLREYAKHLELKHKRLIKEKSKQ